MNTSMYFPMTFVWGRLAQTTLACSGTTDWNPRTSPFPPPDRTVLRGSLWRRVNLKMPQVVSILRVGSRQPTPCIQQFGGVAAATQNGWLSPANPV
jgi:hypothetical protein